MKAAYSQIPDKIGGYTKSSRLYRWDIKPTEHQSSDSEGVMYECYEVEVSLPLTPNKITEAVIRDKWPIDYEQKLINEYNSAIAGIITDPDESQQKIDNYIQFLQQRRDIKARIDADCAELGIIEIGL